MLQLRNSSLGALGIAAAVALAAGWGWGCANDGTAPVSPLLTQAQADSLAEQVALDADDEISGAAMSGVASYSAVASASPVNAAQCTPTRSPASPGDADNDGVPDSLRLDFTGCVLSYPLQTDTVKGTIDVVDPTVALADHAVKRVFTNLVLVRVYTISGKWTSETRNGVRVTSRDATTLQHSETSFRTDYVFRNGGTATHAKTWMSTFTADVAGSIQHDQPLPSGLWNISGTSSWTRDVRTHMLSVTTNPPLHYNASCDVAPRFDAGTLIAAVTRNGQTQTVTIQFTACGQRTVTRS